jgi:hypothetical protein
MTTNTIKTAARSFFTLRPVRNNTITTKSAIVGATAIALTQLGDATTTIIGLEFGAAEANQLMLSVIESTGYPGFVGIKVLSIAFLAWYSWKRKYAPYIISGLYAAVVLWNTYVISVHL